jgi:hypothetical protein
MEVDMNVRRPWLVVAVMALSAMGMSAHAEAYSITNMSTLLSGLYALYSADPLGTDKLYVGGWDSSSAQDGCSSSSQPCDRIYRSVKSGGTWGTPVQNFAINGKSVNDPSIVAPPSTDGVDRSAWLYMYYTIIDYAHYAYPASTQYNEVGFASSVDGGATWTDHGVVIGLSNGLTWNGQSCGAWSPSAIVVGSEIYVYYVSNSQCGIQIGLTKLNANGWQINSSGFVSLPSGIYLANVDVKRRPNGNYLMAGDMSVPSPPQIRYIYVLESTSGTSFTWHSQMNGSAFIDAGSSYQVLTPRLLDVSNSSWKMQFSYVPLTNPDGNWSVQQWDVSE